MATAPRMRLPMRPQGIALTAMACLALLGACTPGGGEASGAAGPSATAAQAGLLDVTGRSLDGGEIDLGDYAGDHLVLWMWAPW